LNLHHSFHRSKSHESKVGYGEDLRRQISRGEQGGEARVVKKDNEEQPSERHI
jgi:hypothetical protein